MGDGDMVEQFLEEEEESSFSCEHSLSQDDGGDVDDTFAWGCGSRRCQSSAIDMHESELVQSGGMCTHDQYYSEEYCDDELHRCSFDDDIDNIDDTFAVGCGGQFAPEFATRQHEISFVSKEK